MTHATRIEDAVHAAASLASAVAHIGHFLQTGESTDLSHSNAYVEIVAFTMADYAWNGVVPANDHIEDMLAELSVAVELLNGNFMLPDGSDYLSAPQKEAIRRLGNAADARWNLDQGHSIRIEQLAALAGVAEKTVRAATNPKGAQPLPVTKNGYWTLIEAEDALAWLVRRNDFRSTHHDKNDPEPSLVTDPDTLASICRNWRTQTGLTIEKLGAALKWSEAQLSAYRGIESQAPGDVIAQFPPRVLHQLGLHLQLPDPAAFAHQAYAVLAIAHARSLSDRQITGAA